jgi:carbon storage regulator CsrA
MQSLVLSGGIKITVVRIGRDNVRIGIDAPDDVEVLRAELRRDGQPFSNRRPAEAAA